MVSSELHKILNFGTILVSGRQLNFRIMKRPSVLLVFASIMVSSACSSSKNTAATEHDDLYYSRADRATNSEFNMVTVADGEQYREENTTPSGFINVGKPKADQANPNAAAAYDAQQKSSIEPPAEGSTIYNFYGNTTYVEDENDLDYTQQPLSLSSGCQSAFTCYDPFWSPGFVAWHAPVRSGWRVGYSTWGGWSVGYDWGWGYGGWGNRWGWGGYYGFYDPWYNPWAYGGWGAPGWYDPYWGSPYYGWNNGWGYYNGYGWNNGYWNGYNDGYNAGNWDSPSTPARRVLSTKRDVASTTIFGSPQNSSRNGSSATPKSDKMNGSVSDNVRANNTLARNDRDAVSTSASNPQTGTSVQMIDRVRTVAAQTSASNTNTRAEIAATNKYRSTSLGQRPGVSAANDASVVRQSEHAASGTTRVVRTSATQPAAVSRYSTSQTQRSTTNSSSSTSRTSSADLRTIGTDYVRPTVQQSASSPSTTVRRENPTSPTRQVQSQQRPTENRSTGEQPGNVRSKPSQSTPPSAVRSQPRQSMPSAPSSSRSSSPSSSPRSRR